MHNKSDKPQTVKIVGTAHFAADPLCPFAALSKYVLTRRSYLNNSEPFFIFRDQSPVQPRNYRKVLKDLIKSNKLDPSRYGIHGMRTGRASDLLQLGLSVETIKKLGRWKSTAVYTYLHD